MKLYLKYIYFKYKMVFNGSQKNAFQSKPFGGLSTNTFGTGSFGQSQSPSTSTSTSLFGAAPSSTNIFPTQHQTAFGQSSSNEKTWNTTTKNQTNHSLFGVSNPSHPSHPESITKEDLSSILYKLNDISQKVDLLTTGKSEKELYVCTPLHNHPMIETDINILANSNYSKGFMCDNCKATVNNLTKFYHCKICEVNGVLFDNCENCIRKTLKI